MSYFRIVVVWHPDVKIPFNLKHNRKIFKIQINIYYKEESLYLERFIYRLCRDCGSQIAFLTTL